ncbi:hypothetical protein SAMN04487991_0053 [Celeribacter neptunius]|uniref:Uncharacterized protein n=1 Tax=Celeribacter neptunius TaxID=588602 RepID=A0A1I3IL62_9RHOB|nr:hypothetical protein SAMN04487991_0053 [Celeribacter neptunius]
MVARADRAPVRETIETVGQVLIAELVLIHVQEKCERPGII